jgi:2'-5' RNA ligase
MRLFVGIPLAAATIAELSAISARLRAAGDGLRWTSAQSWHITLQFLGNSEREQYERVVARLRAVRVPPFPIALEGLGFFDRTGILFAGVKVSPGLLVLQEKVVKATSLCGFTPEVRPHRPHIALARSKGKGRRENKVDIEARIKGRPSFSKFVADQFLLYESFLSSAGSRYEIRERFPLGLSPHVADSC